MNKNTNVIIRISEQDKETLRKLATENQMSMSEFIVNLIRRESDKLKNN